MVTWWGSAEAGGESIARAIARVCGQLVCALGLIVLAAWSLDLAAVENLRPGWPKMSPLTAVAFAIGGVCLYLTAEKSRGEWLRRAARATAALLTVVASLRLGGHLFDWHLVPDLLGFREAVAENGVSTTQMAPFTAVGFVLIGAALTLAMVERHFRVLQTLCLLAVLISLLSLTNYLFGGTPLLPYRKMALHTALGLLVLSIGTLCTRPREGMVALLLSHGAGGAVARQLLLPIVLIPFISGAVRLVAREHQWMSAGTAAAVFTMWYAIVFAALIWVSATVIQRGELRRFALEEELKRQLARLTTIVATEPECVKVVDRDGRLLEMNPAGLAMLEVESLREAQRMRLTEYILPAYRSAFIALHEMVLRGRTGTAEFQIEGQRGTRRWLETHAAPLRDARGDVVALLGITRDIGARKRAEEAQAQARLFRELLDRGNDLIYVADAEEGRLLDCNATLPQRLGYTLEEVRGMAISDLSVAAGTNEQWPTRLAQIRQAGSLIIASEYRRKDGSTVPVEVSLNYVERAPKPLLVSVARDVTERRRQEARIERLGRILTMQSAIHAAVLRIEERDALLREACRVASDIGKYAAVALSLVEPGGREAQVAYWTGRRGLPEPPLKRIPISDGTEPDATVVGQALRTGQLAIVDVTQAGTPLFTRDQLRKFGIRFVVALPLIVDGASIGALTLLSDDREFVRDEELILLQDIATTLSFGLRSRRYADTAQFLAYYDPLTGLAKRPLFCDRLNAFVTHRPLLPERLIVATFDIQDLSGINDTFGRGVGDALVRQVAERLRGIAESDDSLGYLGSGVFVLWVSELAEAPEGVLALIDRMVFERPVEVEGRSFRIACRSGIARYQSDGQDAATLVGRAEAALRHAKESGERYLHFQLKMYSDVVRRTQLEHKMRAALDAGQFVLYYQPQVSVASGRIESVEALLRWQDPEGGLAAPAQFLAALESAGLIASVGVWALAQALRDGTQWVRGGVDPIRVAVNVSTQQICRRRFVEEVLQVLKEAGEPRVGLDLEITESSVLRDLEDTRRKLRRLREAGVRIAIDDFGTGYSALGLLPTLPLDILKIDRVFIQGLPNDPASVALTSSIIKIASTFDLVTVAEGVESAPQLAMLRKFQCSQTQGYLHAKPMSARELGALLAVDRGPA